MSLKLSSCWNQYMYLSKKQEARRSSSDKKVRAVKKINKKIIISCSKNFRRYKNWFVRTVIFYYLFMIYKSKLFYSRKIWLKWNRKQRRISLTRDMSTCNKIILIVLSKVLVSENFNFFHMQLQCRVQRKTNYIGVASYT